MTQDFTEEVTVAIIESNEDIDDKLLDLMQFRLIGPYLAYRTLDDTEIKMQRIDLDYKNTAKNTHSVKLDKIFTRKNDEKLVNFFPIPQSAFQNVK